MLDVIGLALVAFIGALGGGWVWLTNRRKADAEAKKASAEADAETKRVAVEAEKEKVASDVLANNAAFDSLLKSNAYLQGRLAAQDQRIEFLEKEIEVMKAERETLKCENRELGTKVQVLQQKYDVLKKSVIEAFDMILSKLTNHKEDMISTSAVIAEIQEAARSLPKMGPLLQ